MATNYTPWTREAVARAKERESQRKKLDPGYITAEEASALPAEMRTDPVVRARVRMSEEHWPERNQPASQVMRPENLPLGDGGEQEVRRVDAASLFDGGGDS